MITMRTKVPITRNGEEYQVEVEASGNYSLSVATDLRDAVDSLVEWVHEGDLEDGDGEDD